MLFLLLKFECAVKKELVSRLYSWNIVSTRLKDLINQELEKMLQAFDGDRSKIKELLQVFIRQTPLQLDEIASCLQHRHFQRAAEIIHKIKVRYAYLGLQELVTELVRWEFRLKMEHPDTDHPAMCSYVKDKTDLVIEVIHQTGYLEEEKEIKSKAMPLSGKTVLVAEDDEINAMVFDLFIKDIGAETVMASDGTQAIAIASQKEPDLIFMDVHMPFFSGLEAIRQLRQTGCKCPIISLSASTRLNERQNSLDAGANDFLVKPVNREAVNAILLRYLS